MFGFGSSSSSSASEPGKAPSREQRQKCWATRDAFFACLDQHDVLQPPEAGKGAGTPCEAAQKEYETACGKSWIDYFNKRRVLEFRQAATLAEAARQREEAAKR
ncbi:hypothetical protein CspeluHIS016_0902490 [Cutaneotrichosporon spelunceum]|uniref:Cytochrome c oxidase, subunit VIb n=1 Tax=Cutaneotrichosporon spelunceum TaxID=1672016 RepID=A0AAD3U069_9TREE|nr:hypothetical protein CspeluHIS016_0902490 [Cutaneotrichosporon spelunceum]